MKYLEQTHHKGGVIASYIGTGTLRLDDRTEHECEFEIEHHSDLGILMECAF
jgi:hypothetical protein